MSDLLTVKILDNNYCYSKRMNVSLTPELESLINQKVKSGRYNSASEVVREGLRLLNTRDEEHEAKLNALRAEIQKGADSLAAGRYRDGEEAMAEIKERLLARDHRRVLSNRDRDVFLAMLDTDYEPNENLIEAFRLYKELVEE